jgi:large subunit ribosomal protein L18
MAVKVYGKGKNKALKRRHLRLRKKVAGTPEKPRLIVVRSARHISVSLVDDSLGKTIVSAGTLNKGLKFGASDDKTAKAKKVGEAIAQKATKAGITKVVFDRRGHKYHGRVKAVAEGAREAGLEF